MHVLFVQGKLFIFVLRCNTHKPGSRDQTCATVKTIENALVDRLLCCHSTIHIGKANVVGFARASCSEDDQQFLRTRKGYVYELKSCHVGGTRPTPSGITHSLAIDAIIANHADKNDWLLLALIADDRVHFYFQT